MESLQHPQQPIGQEPLAAYDYFVDTHAHLFDGDFDADRAEAVGRAIGAGVRKIVLPAIDSRTHKAVIRMAQEYPDICHAAMGLHPTSINENSRWREELQIVRHYLETRPVKFCAIGEVGLDLHWSNTALSEQCQALAIQCRLAVEYDLPIIFHVRDAWNEIFPLLEPLHRQIRGVFHSFQGSLQDYHQIRHLGDFAVGIGGFITYKNSSAAKVIEQIPLEDIVLETDSPYLTPIPFRGTRNESAHIPVIAAKIAEIKGVTVQEVMEKTTARAESIFFSR